MAKKIIFRLLDANRRPLNGMPSEATYGEIHAFGKDHHYQIEFDLSTVKGTKGYYAFEEAFKAELAAAEIKGERTARNEIRRALGLEELE